MNHWAYAEISWSRVLRVWWSLLWRSTVFCFLPTLVVLASVPSLMHKYGVAAIFWINGLSWLARTVSVLISIWVVRSVLRKRFRDFSIHLIDG